MVAEKIQALVPDADLFEIDTVRRYSEDYMTSTEEAKVDIRQNARPVSQAGNGKDSYRIQERFMNNTQSKRCFSAGDGGIDLAITTEAAGMAVGLFSFCSVAQFH